MIGLAIGTIAKDWTESPDGTRIESPLTRETAVKNKSAPVPIRNASSVMPKILKMNPPKKRRGTITRYRIQEEDVVGKVWENEKNYDLLTAVMVCLGTKRKDTKEELGEKQLLRMLEVLFSDEIQVEEKKWILEKEFKMPMTEELEGEVEEMCNLSKGVWEKGIEQGIEQGIERGLSRGVERGMRETVFSFVKKKMLKGKSLSQIAEELDESEEYLAPFYRLVQENPELSVKELALKA